MRNDGVDRFRHSLGYTDDLIRGCVEEVCEALISVAAGRMPASVANPEVLGNPLFTAKLNRHTRGGRE